MPETPSARPENIPADEWDKLNIDRVNRYFNQVLSDPAQVKNLDSRGWFVLEDGSVLVRKWDQFTNISQDNVRTQLSLGDTKELLQVLADSIIYAKNKLDYENKVKKMKEKDKQDSAVDPSEYLSGNPSWL